MALPKASLVVLLMCCASSLALEAQHETTPPKRRAAGHAPMALPPLPAGSEQIKPVTVDVKDIEPRRILRTVDRILVTTSRREWLFERNAIDPRRVSAAVVEHVEKVIVLYGESDVRNLLGLNGWAEVLTATSEANEATMSVRDGVDPQMLRSCQARFPDYRVVSVSDWLDAK